MDREGLVHPDLREVWDALPLAGLDDLAAARDRFAQEWTRVESDPAVAWGEARVPGMPGDPPVRVKTYAPRGPVGAALPGLIWIHGGGYVLGGADGSDEWCQAMARDLSAVVASVDYRLAPESPYPAGLYDCYAALAWLSAEAGRLGIDARRIGVAGMSAGGGLTAAVSLLARDRGELSVCFQMPLYPMIDDRNQTPSSREISDGRTWNRAKNLLAWRHYLGGEPGAHGVSPYAAPSRAEDLSGLPPTFTMVGSLDLFRDETLDYVARLARAGVPVEFQLIPGGFHGFELVAPEAPVSRRARDAYVGALCRGLAGRRA